MLAPLIARLRFARKYKTLKPLALAEDGKHVAICHGAGEVTLPRRCPHQGAPLETGRVAGGKLHCPWHGCYYELETRRFCPKSFTPGP